MNKCNSYLIVLEVLVLVHESVALQLLSLQRRIAYLLQDVRHAAGVGLDDDFSPLVSRLISCFVSINRRQKLIIK